MARYALFTANARYQNPGLPPLYGPEQDVDDLCGLFKHKLGYDDALALKGVSADEVSVSFNRLGNKARPGDTVLFYFSGHGVESLDRKEQYLLFEHADLSELARGVNTPTACLAVSKLLHNSEDWRGVRRVFIFDACRVLLAARGNAGARGVASELRFGREEALNALARGPVYSSSARRQLQAQASGQGAEGHAEPPVLIKACLSSQEALELPGQKRGIFSLALGKVLDEAARGSHPVATGPALLTRIQQHMSPLLGQLAGSPKQVPWISEGAPEVLLFEPAAVSVPPPSASKPAPDRLDELFKRFDAQLLAGRLTSPAWDCCVGTLALLYGAGLGEGTLGMLQRQLEQAASAPQPSVPVPPRDPVCKPQREMPAGREFRDADWSPRMVVIPAGRFVRGSPDEELERSSCEGPQREVQIRRPFGMGRTVVTFDDYDRYAKDAKLALPEDAGWGRGSRPVINVSWDDAQGYIAWLNARLGLTAQMGYRLPTEAEWEYAARAGTTTAFWWGDTISTLQANYDGNHTYANGSKGEYRQRAVPADAFEANPWGLYNVHGNVWEWVLDGWHDDYQRAPVTEEPWKEGSDKTRRVVRGGSWGSVPADLRAADRIWYLPGSRYSVLGFRLARSI